MAKANKPKNESRGASVDEVCTDQAKDWSYKRALFEARMHGAQQNMDVLAPTPCLLTRTAVSVRLALRMY